MAAARILAAGSVLAALANASPAYGNGTTPSHDGVVYTTEVVSMMTTVCPSPTMITHGSKTYTVTEATTLTITDCPCTISKPVAPTPSASTPENKCANDCHEAYNACRVKPSANMASCAAQFASCLGYSPFNGEGSLVTPTACSAKPTTTPATPSTPGHIVYTTEVVSSLTTVCPSATTMTFNNKTYTVTEPTTLTITDCPCTVSKPHPSASQPAIHDCPAECSAAYNKCRTSEDANMSFCAAQYASCLGYSPFNDEGSLVTPTACSAGATTTPAQPATTMTSPSEPKTTLPAKTCAEKCHEAYNKCRSQSGANMSLCAAEFSSCLGYSPFNDEGSLVTPTACSTGATGITVPGTASNTAVVTGSSGVPVAPTPVPAGAGRIVPGAVLALGAIALL